ncbi:crosslink repair DNA glycosylase YcaQ family protein [Luteipulveratus sp. YIM 133132]|uniref:winged helix-turn-helix domain-containing protein n=1 Tax=Luteipulveratus flavus TaxID=3031728 RepID=UPI0023B1DE9D|nr:crosslink repair DNA glycosylase YcaQ family protein [Luteipulveratus sp. YIM 133132]MDE9365763.1 crosslink repair DNA glycosylase YcaQ family protein [Luteipulveratus sp. YIM 133132]
MRSAVVISPEQARRIWLHAQRLDERAPFGSGPEATRAAVERLGYVQIDTINVIERCHHHILWSRIPEYRRADLRHVQSVDKSVFEYWTHALAYIPTEHYRDFLPDMRAQRTAGVPKWMSTITEDDVRRVLRVLRLEGPLTIRDFKDDVLVEKTHLWASRKPSKAALELAFARGQVTVSARDGMVKTYDLPARHFGWEQSPRPASERQVHTYLLDRALRAQGLISIDSACYGERPPVKAAVRALVDARVRRRHLLPVTVEGLEKVPHWAEPAVLDAPPEPAADLVHILSPFDPLVIQRKRLAAYFGYDHVFEAYVPKAKRLYGYFALPVLVGDEVVAVLDLKTDREQGRLLVQQWTWVGAGETSGRRSAIESELERFERFQLAR